MSALKSLAFIFEVTSFSQVLHKVCNGTVRVQEYALTIWRS